MKKETYRHQEMSAYFHWGWTQSKFIYVDSTRLLELIKKEWKIDVRLNTWDYHSYLFIGSLHKLTCIEERKLNTFLNDYLQEYNLINNPNGTISLKPVSKVLYGKTLNLFLNALYTKNLLPQHIRVYG